MKIQQHKELFFQKKPIILILKLNLSTENKLI